MLAENSDAVSERLPETRTNERERTSSRSRTRVLIGTRNICRTIFGSVMAASRSVLRIPLKRPPMPASAPRKAVSTRSGAEAKLVSPPSEAKTAPPMSAAPHSPVKMAPLNHCSDSRRRSTRPPVPPSAESGGSLPRSSSASSLRFAPRNLAWSKNHRPPHSRSHLASALCDAEVGNKSGKKSSTSSNGEF